MTGLNRLPTDMIEDRGTKQKLNDKLSSLDTQLADKAQQSDLNTTNSKITLLSTRDKTRIRGINTRKFYPYVFPSGFNWNAAPIGLATDGFNFITNFDVSQFKNTGGTTYYVDTINGNNTNDGLTSTTARKTIESALVGCVSGDTIMIIDPQNNVIYYDDAFNGRAVNKSLNIIAENDVIIVNTGAYSYVADGTAWKFSGSAGASQVYSVIDLYCDEPIKYELVGSTSECQSTKGSFYTDNAGNLWINTLNGQIDPKKIIPLQNLDCMSIDCSTENIKLYMENIELLGGLVSSLLFQNTATYDQPELYLKNCKFGFNKSNNTTESALGVLGAKYAFLQDCEARGAACDGFGYDALNGTAPKVIEVNCKGYSNGINIGNSANDTYNGSTIHGGVIAIRVNGEYYSNCGMNVGDVGSVTQSLNLGCYAFDSVSSDPNSFNIGFGCLDGAYMWLDNCNAFGSAYDIAGTNIYNHNSIYDNGDPVINY